VEYVTVPQTKGWKCGWLGRPENSTLTR